MGEVSGKRLGDASARKSYPGHAAGGTLMGKEPRRKLPHGKPARNTNWQWITRLHGGRRSPALWDIVRLILLFVTAARTLGLEKSGPSVPRPPSPAPQLPTAPEPLRACCRPWGAREGTRHPSVGLAYLTKKKHPLTWWMHALGLIALAEIKTGDPNQAHSQLDLKNSIKESTI